MRVYLCLLAVLVPAVTAGFFDRMVARYRQRREQRQETRLQRGNPHYVDYQDELQHLLSESAANMESEHAEYATGVPVGGGFGERQRGTRQRLRGERLRGQRSRDPAQSPRGPVQDEGGPRNRLRGSGMLLFGRRRRPAGRSRLHAPPTPAPQPTTRPTESPPHRIRLPTAIDGFDGISPPPPPTRQPAAYIGPHGRLVLRDRDALNESPRRRPPPPPRIVESPAATRGSLMRGCGGRRPCPGSDVPELRVPIPLPTPPPEYRQQRASSITTTPWAIPLPTPPPEYQPRSEAPPIATTPWTTTKLNQEAPTTTSKQPTSQPPGSTQQPQQPSKKQLQLSTEKQQSSMTTSKPSLGVTESLPGGLIDAMTSVLDTARVAMLAMMPHVKTPESDPADVISVSQVPDVPLLGQSSTEHSSSVTQQRATQRFQPEKMRTEDQLSSHSGKAEDVPNSRRSGEYVSDEEEPETRADTRWEHLLKAAGEEDLEVVYALLDQVRENRAIMGRLRDRQQLAGRGRSTNGNGKIKFTDTNARKEYQFRAKYSGGRRKEQPARDQSSIRAQLAAIVASLDSEDNRDDQMLLQTVEADRREQLDRHSGEEIVAPKDEGGLKAPFRILRDHNGFDTGPGVVHPGNRERPRLRDVSPNYDTLDLSPGEVWPHDKGYSAVAGDVKLRDSFRARPSYLKYDDNNSKNSDVDLSVRSRHRHGYLRGENYNSKTDQEQFHSKSLVYPGSTLQLHESDNFKPSEQHDMNSQLGRGHIREGRINSKPNNADDDLYLPPDDERGNKFILGPSDLRDLDTRPSDDSAGPRDGRFQVRPINTPFEGVFSTRPSDVRDDNFESRDKYTKFRGNENRRPSSTEGNDYRHNVRPDAQPEDDRFSSWFPADESNPRFSDTYDSNARPNIGPNSARFRDETLPLSRPSVPPDETKHGGDIFNSKPVDPQYHDTDSLSGAHLAGQGHYEAGNKQKQTTGIAVPHRSESPLKATPRGDDAVMEPPAVPSISTTTVRTAPPTTITSQETTSESLSLDKLMEMLSQVSQRHLGSSMATTSPATVGMESTSTKPIPITTETEATSTLRVDKGQVDHSTVSEAAHSERTTPSYKISKSPQAGSSSPTQHNDQFEPATENSRKMTDEPHQDSYSTITPTTTEVKGRPQYAGTLPPPPTAPMILQKHGSTAAKPEEETVTTAGSITDIETTSSSSVGEPRATSPSGLQRLEPVAVPTASGWELVPTASLPASTGPEGGVEAVMPSAPPTSDLQAPARAILYEPEAFAVPTSSDWLLAPPMTSAAATSRPRTETTPSDLFEEVAVPMTTDWFVTTVPATPTKEPITTAIPILKNGEGLDVLTTSSWQETTDRVIQTTEYVNTDEDVTRNESEGIMQNDEDKLPAITSMPQPSTTPQVATTKRQHITRPASATTTQEATTKRQDTTTRPPPTSATEVTTTKRQDTPLITTTEITTTKRQDTPLTTTTEVTATKRQDTTLTTTTEITTTKRQDTTLTTTTVVTSTKRQDTTRPPTTTTTQATQVTTTKRPDTTTTKTLSLLEQVMTRSVPFTLKRRRYTTPTPMKTSTTEPTTEEPGPTTPGGSEPRSTMPKSVKHITTIPELAPTNPSSLTSAMGEATLETTPFAEENGESLAPAEHKQSSLPQMSPELRLALVRELLKQMQNTDKTKNNKKTKAQPETTQAATQSHPEQLAARPEEMQATEQPRPTEAISLPPAQPLPESGPETQEDPHSPIKEDHKEPIHGSATPAQLEPFETNEQNPEKDPDVVSILKGAVKADGQVQTEAQRIAAQLNGDGVQHAKTSVTQKPELSKEDKEPVTSSAFLLALRERAKKRPSLRSSRRRTKPKLRPRAKIRKSEPRGPRTPRTPDVSPREALGTKYPDEHDEQKQISKSLDLEENESERAVHTRAKLHQLVNEELKGKSDALNDLDKTPDIKTQGANPSEDQSKDNPEEYINHTKDLDIGQAAAEASENPPAIADNASREPGTRTEEESDITTAIETDASTLSNHEAKYTLESAMELPGASQLIVVEEHDAKLSEKTNEFLEEADTKTAEESVTGHPDNVDIRPLERPDATASPEIQTMHAEETDTKPLEKIWRNTCRTVQNDATRKSQRKSKQRV